MCNKEQKYMPILPRDYFIIKRIGDLGITRNYTGFYYIVEIMDYLINQEMVIKSFSREIYPSLAEKYGKKSCTVERDIRNVIDKLWEGTLKEKLVSYWDKDRKPTCHDFIHILRKYLLMLFA